MSHPLVRISNNSKLYNQRNLWSRKGKAKNKKGKYTKRQADLNYMKQTKRNSGECNDLTKQYKGMTREEYEGLGKVEEISLDD